MSGIRTFVGPYRRENLTPDGLGGVFHSLQEFAGRDPGSTDRRTFWDLAGRQIYAVMVYGGSHQIVEGVDGNGYPYIQAVGSPTPSWWTLPPENLNTRVAVFAL